MSRLPGSPKLSSIGRATCGRVKTRSGPLAHEIEIGHPAPVRLRASVPEARHQPVVIAGIDESHISDPLALVPRPALDAEARFVARDLQASGDQLVGIQRRDLMLGFGPWDPAEEPASR